jgi:WhiB family transcriptional regulator, redox-sensing transcriptional regulator
VIDLKWHEYAACRGEETSRFYVDEFEFKQEINALRAICKECPVFAECEDHSLTWETFGFWAGLTESERREVKRQRKIVRRSLKTAVMRPRKGDDHGFINRN